MRYLDRFRANYITAAFELNVLDCFERFNCVSMEENPLRFYLVCDAFTFNLNTWDFDGQTTTQR